MQFIAKIVAYKRDYGMMMGVTKTPDQILPNDFTFLFPCDTDENRGIEMTFYKRGQPIMMMKFDALSKMKDDEIGLTLPNTVSFSGTTKTVNLIQLCTQNDAILFKYTSKHGEGKSLRFPLTGLAEHYLDQFVE